jgi:SAM-dependent methyltransferase
MLDHWGWWPKDLTGRIVADIGCFTGGLSLYLAARNPSLVYAVDEIPQHLRQCACLAEVFAQNRIRTVEASVFSLTERIPESSLDLVLFSGVLYHLSDMLVGLYILRRLLKPGSPLLIETNGVDDFKQSYANFGRFYAGMWWQPSGLCVKDMCGFMGFEDTEVRFYQQNRCLVRTTRSYGEEIPFKRGLNWKFENLLDATPRPMDPGVMAPVRSGREPG